MSSTMSRLHEHNRSLFPINSAQEGWELEQRLRGRVQFFPGTQSKLPQVWSTPASISAGLEGNKHTSLRSTTGAFNSFIQAL